MPLATPARFGLVAGIAAVVWAIVVLNPMGPATIDPDASSSVLYFQRILGGERLEAFVPTTPKPLLTLVYGVTWALTHDWRALVWETIAAFGLAVGASAAFVAALNASVGMARVGVMAGAAFVTAGLLGSSDVLLEVSRANSLIWALAGWAIAGYAVVSRPPRPWVAGVALLIAGLCRFETLALAAVAVLAVALWARRPSARLAKPVVVTGIAETSGQFRRRTAEVAARQSGGVWPGAAVAAVVALLAIPIAMVHDWLLAGDPLYWLSVPARYTDVFNPGLESIGPLSYAGTLVGRLAPEWPLILLAVVGVAALVRGRAWLALAGLAAVAGGVALLLFWLAWRATYISNRYYEPIDLALIVTAAVGTGWIVSALAGRIRAGSSATGWVAPIAAAVAVVAGVVLTWPALPWDRRATTELADVRAASVHLAATSPLLVELPFDELLVPSRDVARFAVETGMPLTKVLNSYALLLNGGPEGLTPGQMLFHDSAADRPVALYKPFEVADDGVAGGHDLVRVDQRNPGIWILSVQ